MTIRPSLWWRFWTSLAFALVGGVGFVSYANFARFVVDSNDLVDGLETEAVGLLGALACEGGEVCPDRQIWESALNQMSVHLRRAEMTGATLGRFAEDELTALGEAIAAAKNTGPVSVVEGLEIARKLVIAVHRIRVEKSGVELVEYGGVTGTSGVVFVLWLLILLVNVLVPVDPERRARSE